MRLLSKIERYGGRIGVIGLVGMAIGGVMSFPIGGGLVAMTTDDGQTPSWDLREVE